MNAIEYRQQMGMDMIRDAHRPYDMMPKPPKVEVGIPASEEVVTILDNDDLDGVVCCVAL